MLAERRMLCFHFEVNRETNRARVVVDYTYPDAAVCGADGGLGPQPTQVQPAGLTYNKEEHEVVYSEEERIQCARCFIAASSEHP